MATAIQLVITNLLIIAMGVFVFILMKNMRQQAAKSAAAGAAGAGAPEMGKELLERLDSLEVKIKSLPAKEDKTSYDQLMEMKRNVSDIYDRIESINGKNAATEKTIKELREELKNASVTVLAGGKAGREAAVADSQAIINEAKKEINKAISQQQESMSGANDEIVGRISVIEQMYNKMADSIENSLNDMKKQADDKIKRMETTIKKIENTVKNVEETDQELLAKHILKDQAEKMEEFKKELREELKSSAFDEEAFQKIIKKQDMTISGLKEYIKETLEKFEKNIEEVNEKEKSDEKMIDFIDANLYEIKKRLDGLNKK